jgi:hypothetical protein
LHPLRRGERENRVQRLDDFTAYDADSLKSECLPGRGERVQMIGIGATETQDSASTARAKISEIALELKPFVAMYCGVNLVESEYSNRDTLL